MKNLIAIIKFRIAFLQSVVKMFTIDYVLNGTATNSLCMSTLSRAEKYVVDLGKVVLLKIENVSLKSVPIRNLLSLTKMEKLKFVLGISKLYMVECVEHRRTSASRVNPHFTIEVPYKVHLIASSKEKATQIVKAEYKNDTVNSVTAIDVCERYTLFLDEMIQQSM